MAGPEDIACLLTALKYIHLRKKWRSNKLPKNAFLPHGISHDASQISNLSVFVDSLFVPV